MKYIVLTMLAFVFTGCTLPKHSVEVVYRPCGFPERVVGAEVVEVAVNVKDLRVNGSLSGRADGYGLEIVNIDASNDVSEVFKNALIWELEERGFIIGCGGRNLNIEICKLFNAFMTGFVTARADSETVLNVTLKNSDGIIVFAKTVIGLGDEKSCFVANESNASLALDRSIYDAVQKLVNDPDFICALLS